MIILTIISIKNTKGIRLCSSNMVLLCKLNNHLQRMKGPQWANDT